MPRYDQGDGRGLRHAFPFVIPAPLCHPRAGGDPVRRQMEGIKLDCHVESHDSPRGDGRWNYLGSRLRGNDTFWIAASVPIELPRGDEQGWNIKLDCCVSPKDTSSR